ncbi:MAG: hypothetical protein M3P11_09855 [Actinomycetota bacterium]|nr:hypothetical protein [Actinomycetota bacterium]
MTEPPTWNEVQELILNRKPPLACTVVETNGASETRRARVVFDGAEGWWIDDGVRTELRLNPNRAVFVDDQGVELVALDALVYANGWVKSAIEGRLLAYLDHAQGQLHGNNDVLGRSCWLYDVVGLKAGSDAPIRLAIDTATGVVMQMHSVGPPAWALEIRDLRIGSLE